MVYIKGKRLVLRSWEISDLEDLVDGINNVNVSKWLASIPYPYTKEMALNFITSSSDTIKMAIALQSNNKAIGGTTLTLNKQHGIVKGGIWLNEKYIGKGYGTEAFALRAKYAFENLGARKLENGYFKGNNASKRMQEKLGYKEEGIKRKNFVCLATGEIHDEVITGLFKEEFEKANVEY